LKLAVRLAMGESPQPKATSKPTLVMVAKAMTDVPTCTERLLGDMATSKEIGDSLSALKVAVTDVLAFIVTVQLPVPVQPPPFHLTKTEASDGVTVGVAVRVTTVPLL